MIEKNPTKFMMKDNLDRWSIKM